MAVEGINQNTINPSTVNPSFAGEGKKKNSMAFPLTLCAAGATTGYFMGTPITAKEILKNDKFELSKKVAENATDAENATAGKIVKAIADHKNATASTTEAFEILFGKEKNEITVKELLEKQEYKGLDTKEKFNKLAEEINNTLAEETKKLAPAKEKVDQAADEASKQTATKELKDLEKKLDDLKSQSENNKLVKELIDGAKDGKITKATFIEKGADSLKGEVEKSIAEGIESLGKNAPKVKSWKKAGIYGAVALVAGFILKAIFGKKKEAPEA